jgi:hypothetical protein
MDKMKTHTSGFKFRVTRNITKKEYIHLCKNISQELNKLYNLIEIENKICIEPDPICEGGMVFIEGNNLCSNYKAIRHPNIKHNIQFVWPSITPQTYNEWLLSDEVLLPKDMISQTKIKSFGESSSWSFDELKIFRDCYEEFDMICNNMPTKKSLST